VPPQAWWIVYNLLQLFTLPLMAGWLLYRKLAQGKGEGWSERSGGSPVTAPDSPSPVWVHAVSAGEVAAAAPLLRVFTERYPEIPLVMSTVTPAGKNMAERLCPQAETIFYYPWDLLPSVLRSLRRVRPRAVLLMEAEFWPNFLSACRARRVPVIVANGRISDRGYRRARKIQGVMQWMYGMVDALGMQSAEDASRTRALGAPPDRIKVLGQTKFDQEMGPLTPEEGQELRSSLGIPMNARVIVGGSTRPGEEEALLDSLTALKPEFPGLKLLLAPRHLERIEEVDALVKARGFTSSRRTASVEDADVILLDTMGELGTIYAVADISFVGGTLADIGGHNLLQPVAQGKPVLFGPHTQNVRDIADLLMHAGVGFRVADSSELTERLRDALTHGEEWGKLKERALQVVENNKGASKRYVDLLMSVLSESGAKRGS
jgi:3-deoxy-D-manno-octulosonic-acid transferase